MSEAVGVSGVPLARQDDRISERARCLAALAVALQARIEAVSRTVLATWHQRSPEAASTADLRVQDDILRTTESATFAIVQYLSNGQLQSEDQARVIAATGKAPLRDTIALAELNKLYLYWRDVMIAVLTEEAHALALDADLILEATAIVRAGSDGSIIRMAKQFDAERRRLQRDLAVEQSRLEHHAFHDALTGLPNRRLFFDRLSHALDLSHRHSSGIGLLFIDVDQFKAINDRLGHDCGDRVLIAVAERLVETARDTDTVARLGGDEFVVLYEQLHDPSREGIALAERIAEAFAETITAGDHELHASASIGIAVTIAGGDADTLIRQADDAMYIAKRRGRGGYHLWNAR
ncbi:MAG TPA: GGDEF domain-containing protein [Acidimicrobiia bacterium]|jgi:diguanylate cyclase (GGDEF)-like protein|nr:GGDEF domain-containing protein [Acidimicrobiia bacterium]